MWTRTNFSSWLAEIRQHKLVGVIGFAAGSVSLALTSNLDRLSQERHSVLSKAAVRGQWGPVFFGILGMALLIYLMGSLEHPNKRMGAFIFCLFGGAIAAS